MEASEGEMVLFYPPSLRHGLLTCKASVITSTLPFPLVKKKSAMRIISVYWLAFTASFIWLNDSH